MLKSLWHGAQSERGELTARPTPHTTLHERRAEEVENQAIARPNVSSHSECVLTLMSEWIQESSRECHVSIL